MGYNAIEIDGDVKLDLSQDTVTEETLPEGVTAHNADGDPIEGKMKFVKSINGKDGDVTLGAEDVGARPDTWTPSAEDVGARPDTWTPSAEDVGARPNTWMPSYSDVNADKAGTAQSLVSGHNTNTDAHNDIRLLIQGISDRLNAFANSDDESLDQAKEFVAYMQANRGLIEAVTTQKVNYTDIINDLVTNVTSKPLSAAQGVALKALIDELDTDKLDASALTSAINTALAQAKASGKFDGKKGDPGYSPVKGTDYYTPEEEAEWEAFIVDELAKRGQLKPEFANSVEELKESGDTTKLYVLPDGYIYAYTTTITSGGIKTITKRVTEGFLDNNRLSTSSGELRPASGFVTTPEIDISNLSNWKIRLTGIQWANTADGSVTGDGFAFAIWKSDNSRHAGGYTDYVGMGFNDLAFKNYCFKINIISTNEVEFTPYDNAEWEAFIAAENLPYTKLQFSGKGTSSDAIVEVIYEDTVEGSTVTEWTNTGHAFVPADYEGRIIDLEADVSKLENQSETLDARLSSIELSADASVPAYVVAEATMIANEVLSVRNAHSFVFGAISDIHSTGSDVSTLHAGQGLREIDKLTTLDACLNFGDGIDGYFENINVDSFLHIHRCLHSVQREIPYIQMQGNHDQLETDTTEEAQQKYFAYIGANNIGTVTDWDNRFRNYGYRDFPDQRMRVIYLNSVDVSEGENIQNCWLSAQQLSWFVNTALDFTNKEGWAFIIGSHHPLNWWYEPSDKYMRILLTILYDYKRKYSGSVTVDGTTVNYNFENTTAEFIAHFHGHLHNFRAEKLGADGKPTKDTNGVLTITIPNACFSRNNHYGTDKKADGSYQYSEEMRYYYGDIDENGEQRQFNKKIGAAEDTAFNVVVVDRQYRKIHCFNYGAGIDREISY